MKVRILTNNKSNKNVNKLIFVLLLIVIFVIGVWYINYLDYNKFVRDNYQKYGKAYIKSTVDYSLTVRKPYLNGFKGNLAIADIDNTVTLIIWPKSILCKDEEFGLIIKEEDIGYIFYVDKNMKYIESLNNDFNQDQIEIINNLLLKNEDILIRLYKEAYYEWFSN